MSKRVDELIAQGLDALKAATGLSGEEQQIVQRAISKIEAASVDVPTEEPTDDEAEDSEPEPKAAPSRRSSPAGRGKKGK